MSNKDQSSNGKYNLAERSEKFGEAIIDFVKTLPENTMTKPLISQLIRSATSIGANYMEADCAESKKDFKHKIGISKKESKETTHWLRMIARTLPDRANDCRKHYKEAAELTLIFSAIIVSSNKNKTEDNV